MPIFRLAIATPLRQLFDYLPPSGLDAAQLADIRPGVRVSAPFGKRQVCAVLVEVAADSELPEDKLRPATEVLDAEPLVTEDMLGLCQWAARYYKAPPGEILAAALPAGLRKGGTFKFRGEKRWRLSVDGLGLPPGALKRAPRQAQLLKLLQEAGNEGISEQALKESELAGATRRQLQKKGLVQACEQIPQPRTATASEGPSLNEEQASAVRQITDTLGGFCCHLLQGVTGSGKTEVYLDAIEKVLAAGQQALVLVPEIGLTPQTVRRFEARFDADIAVLHSGLTDVARQKAWESAYRGLAHIVIGTRSAVFTPLARPGLIIIDEEHDSSYKQQDGFLYSARDLAVKRAQVEKVPIVLGTATPSLESLHNAIADRYRHLELNRRAGGGTLPTFQIQDVRGSPLQSGLSEPLVQAVTLELQAGNQVLLFLNRRGFAPTLQCHDCGHVAQCRHCDARLTVHRNANELRCHHCDWRQQLPRRCPQCNSAGLTALGVGTEQTETALGELFPDIPVHRVDRDSMQRRNAMETLIESLGAGEPAILLGTQMLTKGHHFPDVTLVGLLDVDAGLFSPDFRGPERIGQLLTQVSGRAGRASKPGRVIIQTHYPDHPLLTVLTQQGYGEYAHSLLEQRRASHMPPFGHLLLFRTDARKPEAAQQFLAEVRAAAQPHIPRQTRLVGPLPSPMPRRSGRHRAQLLALCHSRNSAQATADTLIAAAGQSTGANRLRWSLDVDPLDFV